MIANERLHQARLAIVDGRYEEALNEFVWFHHHALEEEPAQYGVRLSFALHYWMELAALYPKARQVLEEIRDQKTAILIKGEGDKSTFHDVEAINEILGELTKTHALFVQLTTSNPSLAQSCALLALSAIVAACDYELAARYLPEPESRIDRLSASLNDDIEKLKDIKRHRTVRRDAYTNIYASEVALMLSIVAGSGHPEEANRLKVLALKSIQSPSIRKAVKKVLEAQLATP